MSYKENLGTPSWRMKFMIKRLEEYVMIVISVDIGRKKIFMYEINLEETFLQQNLI